MEDVWARYGLCRLKIKVNTWIVYRRPREPGEFYAFAEQATMQKHLDVLMQIQRWQKMAAGTIELQNDSVNLFWSISKRTFWGYGYPATLSFMVAAKH